MEQLYYNGKIITISGRDFEDSPAEAVLVRDGMIAAVGSLDDVRAASGEQAVMVNLEGRCLMPSFIDAHGHMVMNGQMSLCADLTGCTSFADIVRVLKDFTAARQGAGDMPDPSGP